MKELNSDIFNLGDAQPEPSAGSLLVARPTVDDPYFGRSVILMLSHHPDGSMGLMLNRPLNILVSDVLDEQLQSDVPVYLGGPVETDRMFFVHDLGSDIIPDADELGGGLWVGGDIEAMCRYLNACDDVESHVRFFLGYSGWEPGQLRDELDRGDWVVLEASADVDSVLLTPHEQQWDAMVECFGSRYRLWRNWPVEPSDN